MKEKDWLIKNMPEDVYKVIKEKAVDYGCTIPELFRLEFMDYIPAENNSRNISWTIKKVNKNTIAAIKSNAKKSGMSVGVYLDRLLKVREVVFNARAEKAKLKKEFKERIKAALKDF